MHTKISKSNFFHFRCFYAYKNRKKAQDLKRFFFLDVLWSLCAFCAFYAFFPLRLFYARWRLFLFSFAYVLFILALRLSFSFAYVLFVFFMLVGSFFERYKTSPIPSFTILLRHYHNIFLLSHYIFIITTIYFYHHNTFLSLLQYISIITIHFYHYHNTFLLSQYISIIITIHFHYHNTFLLSQYISIITIHTKILFSFSFFFYI